MSIQVEVTHTFRAPRELVFKALTEPEHLKNWWGPKGWTFTVAKFDLRPGGVFLYSQKPADGDIMWVKFVYGEIIAPEKIVYNNFFSDEEGNATRAPWDPNWPLETNNVITLVENEGVTTLTTIISPVSPTEDEANSFGSSQEILQEGFSGTFEQLAEYLLKL